jgi:Phospholipase_D-nuclease N-terminal/Short C-terminal domain
MVANTFWENFFLLLIFLPLAMTWAFAFMDIFRRDDIGGLSKALWLTCVLLVPFFGTLIYLVTRPRGATPEERANMARGDFGEPYAATNDVAQLNTLADLHERGKLTDDEFAAEKARLLGIGSSAST